MGKPPRPTHTLPDLDDDGQPLEGGFNYTRRIDRGINEVMGLCRGILLDDVVTDGEITGIEQWIKHNAELQNEWPVSVLHRRIQSILADGYISEEEREDLRNLLYDVTGGGEHGDVVQTNWATRLPVDQPQPDVIFDDHEFCFTGKFFFGTRKKCEEAVVDRGGSAHASIRYRTRYLILGQMASRDWAHPSFGRKIEKAMEYRGKRSPIAIIAEEHWTAFL